MSGTTYMKTKSLYIVVIMEWCVKSWKIIFYDKCLHTITGLIVKWINDFTVEHARRRVLISFVLIIKSDVPTKVP